LLGKKRTDEAKRVAKVNREVSLSESNKCKAIGGEEDLKMDFFDRPQTLLEDRICCSETSVALLP